MLRFARKYGCMFLLWELIVWFNFPTLLTSGLAVPLCPESWCLMTHLGFDPGDASGCEYRIFCGLKKAWDGLGVAKSNDAFTG